MKSATEGLRYGLGSALAPIASATTASVSGQKQYVLTRTIRPLVTSSR